MSLTSYGSQVSIHGEEITNIKEEQMTSYGSQVSLSGEKITNFKEEQSFLTR